MPAARKAKPILVKRYTRSRLYDATHGHYVTVEQLRGRATKSVAFQVTDTETEEDVKRVLLA